MYHGTNITKNGSGPNWSKLLGPLSGVVLLTPHLFRVVEKLRDLFRLMVFHSLPPHSHAAHCVEIASHGCAAASFFSFIFISCSKKVWITPRSTPASKVITRSVSRGIVSSGSMTAK